MLLDSGAGNRPSRESSCDRICSSPMPTKYSKLVTAQEISNTQEMHNISIERKLSLDLLEQAISLDIEIYDNPEYHDKLNMAKYNLNSVFNITWNFITAISSVISLCGSFIILAQTNIIYGVLILITSIPSALTNKRYIKIFYNLNKSQIQMERKKNYLFYVGTSREYAQDII